MSIVAQLRRLLQKPLPHHYRSLQILRAKFISTVYYRHIFGSFGEGSYIESPLRLQNVSHIHIGSGVRIGPGVRLEAIFSSPSGNPRITIENNVNIENDVSILAHCDVRIRENAGLGARCIVMDASHPFLDVNDPVPIHMRLSDSPSFVEVGEGTMLGAGSYILPNVRLGKGCVVGANSVVRNNIPDHCVVGGNPGEILLRYDAVQSRWVRHKK